MRLATGRLLRWSLSRDDKIISTKSGRRVCIFVCLCYCVLVPDPKRHVWKVPGMIRPICAENAVRHQTTSVERSCSISFVCLSARYLWNEAIGLPDLGYAISMIQTDVTVILVQKVKVQDHNQSINQSMAVTDAGTKVPLCPYHTFYTLLIFKYNLITTYILRSVSSSGKISCVIKNNLNFLNISNITFFIWIPNRKKGDITDIEKVQKRATMIFVHNYKEPEVAVKCQDMSSNLINSKLCWRVKRGGHRGLHLLNHYVYV